MINCASLVHIENNRLLLVRVRNNKIWYFPGGKIESHETPTQALVRELQEELNLTINPAKLAFVTDVISLNHDQTDYVHLFAYRLPVLQKYRAGGEISEIRWFEMSDTQHMAPAVINVLKVIQNVI